MNNGHEDLADALEFIDPRDLSYSEWVEVGMGLKSAGLDVSLWDDWSRRDIGRYHDGECERKWNSFASSGVNSGTVAHMAMVRGWHAPGSGGHELDWNDIINDPEPYVIVNKGWVEGTEIKAPRETPMQQLTKYLETLFDAGDFVGYVTRSFEKDGKYMPDRGCWDRTAGKLIEELSRCGGDMGAVFGDYNPDVGAWIRFNPLDGKGIKNENVSEFRFALVESDSMEIEKQNEILRRLELPIACLVHSGKKSLHAIVRVEAESYDEYRKRVDFLYSVCRKNGLEVDQQNKNPSRLSRLPGVMRNGVQQSLVDTNIGKASWNEWREWVEQETDDLPDPDNMASIWGNLPELSPPLIDGILRQGHKLLIAGPSKAGKSFLLIELCIAIAEGKPWLGIDCAQGRVLYVNLELDKASCLHRIKAVYEALGWQPNSLENLDVWNLRGKSTPMDKLAPKMIRRARTKKYTAIVIDPIYKVITGDENSADQMAQFCNQFDKVCTELECAVIYAHHHSKGSQGGKRAVDRASGSGVFSRDPDALLDLIELERTDAFQKQFINTEICNYIRFVLKAAGALDKANPDALCTSDQALKEASEFISQESMKVLETKVNDIAKAAAISSAWRIEATLREFPKPDPINVLFNYPVHVPETQGILDDLTPEGEFKPNIPPKSRVRPPGRSKKQEREDGLESAFSASIPDEKGEVKLIDMADFADVTRNTMKNRIDDSSRFERTSTGTVKRK